MKNFSRLVGVTAAASMIFVLGACADDEPTAESGDTATEQPPMTSEMDGGEGVTTVEDIYGPACDQVPTSGEGSAEGMIDDPVGTAASNNPLLSTLTQAVTAADLVDTLNSTDAGYTVFAPANSAFEALPAGTMDTVMADPKGQLTDILTYHVIPQRYDAEGLAAASEVETVQGEMLTISGEKGSLKIDEQEQAAVLCGNIPTANATVFVVDKVLMPPAA